MLKRLYHPFPLQHDCVIQLDANEQHYAVTVLRLKPDAEVMVFNAIGTRAYGRIKTIKPHLTCHLHTVTHQPPKPPYIHLIQGVAKPEKMAWITEKATETGAASIQFVAMQRSQSNYVKAAQNQDRWQRIILNACRQSNASFLPTWGFHSNLSCAIKHYQQRNIEIVMLCPHAENVWQPTNTDEAAIVIGPEGGFSPEEQTLVLTHNLSYAKFNMPTLRTETAAIAALSIYQHQYHWFNISS